MSRLTQKRMEHSCLIALGQITHDVWGIRASILDRGFLRILSVPGVHCVICRPKILKQPEGYSNLKYLKPSCTGLKMVKILMIRVCVTKKFPNCKTIRKNDTKVLAVQSHVRNNRELACLANYKENGQNRAKKGRFLVRSTQFSAENFGITYAHQHSKYQ